MMSLTPKQTMWAEKRKQQLLACYHENLTEEDWGEIVALSNRIVESGRHHPAIILMVHNTLKQMEQWEKERDAEERCL